MDGNLPEGALPNSDLSDSIPSRGRADFASQTSLPLDHLNAMFGLSFIFAATLLVGSFAYSFPSAEIDIQAPQMAEYRVDINSGRWVEFANLPSIGKKTAQSIVEYGKSIGGYRSVEQLLEVKGVGQKTLAVMEPYLNPMPATFAAKPVALPESLKPSH